MPAQSLYFLLPLWLEYRRKLFSVWQVPMATSCNHSFGRQCRPNHCTFYSPLWLELQLNSYCSTLLIDWVASPFSLFTFWWWRKTCVNVTYICTLHLVVPTNMKFKSGAYEIVRVHILNTARQILTHTCKQLMIIFTSCKQLVQHFGVGGGCRWKRGTLRPEG